MTLPPHLATPVAIDAAIRDAVAEVHANGLALAVIDSGQVVYGNAFGHRNEAGHLLRSDTVMVAASLTKPVFAYLSCNSPMKDGLISMRQWSATWRSRCRAIRHGAALAATRGGVPSRRACCSATARDCPTCSRSNRTESLTCTSIPVHALPIQAPASTGCSSCSSAGLDWMSMPNCADASSSISICATPA